MSYLITGYTDFRVIKLLGFFNLILLAYSFFLVYRSSNKGILSFIPIAFLLFSPIVYGVHLWAITSFQYTLSVAFSLLSLFFLQPSKSSAWYWGILFAILATLTNLDGLSVIPIGLVWLIMQQRRKESLWYLAFSVVYLFIYFQGFKFSVASKVLPFSELLPIASLSFVAFTGSFASILSDTHGFKLSLLLGVVILLGFIILQLLKLRRNLSNASFLKSLTLQFDFTDIALLRLLATAVMIAIGRSSDGPEGVLALRFLVYSVSILILFYLLILKIFKNRSLVIFKVSAFVFAILSWGFIYLKFDAGVKTMGSELKSDSFNYTNNQIFLHQYFDLTELGPSFYRNYRFPEFFGKNAVSLWKAEIQKANGGGNYRMVADEVGKTGIYSKYFFPVTEVRLNDIPPTIPGTEVYLGLLSNSYPEHFYLVALRDLNNSWQSRVFKRNLNRKFFVSIEGKVRKGVYHAGICWLEQGKPKILPVAGSLSIGH